eukprot:CAMPEP_0117429036 /NCGR_PEP_ID=MMETSP0758-20121206/8613_1 /TAXON_ID=63605 /ORGANISM="Percolomonas cosmopolitus, Strain AE-1 (ATCC 50343)" /LENGTH=398 /DNA_ID=CAMNT_0005215729 /DNA_START=193 /DNA_END=1385 /DNA_ORIENTATION=-
MSTIQSLLDSKLSFFSTSCFPPVVTKNKLTKDWKLSYALRDSNDAFVVIHACGAVTFLNVSVDQRRSVYLDLFSVMPHRVKRPFVSFLPTKSDDALLDFNPSSLFEMGESHVVYVNPDLNVDYNDHSFHFSSLDRLMMVPRLDADERVLISHALAISSLVHHYKFLLNNLSSQFRSLNYSLHRDRWIRKSATRRRALRIITMLNEIHLSILLDLDRNVPPSEAWESSRADVLWEALNEEFSLLSRLRSLDAEQSFLNDRMQFLVDQTHNSTGHRLEWIIIVLIAIELLPETHSFLVLLSQGGGLFFSWLVYLLYAALCFIGLKHWPSPDLVSFLDRCDARHYRFVFAFDGIIDIHELPFLRDEDLFNLGIEFHARRRILDQLKLEFGSFAVTDGLRSL